MEIDKLSAEYFADCLKYIENLIAKAMLCLDCNPACENNRFLGDLARVRPIKVDVLGVFLGLGLLGRVKFILLCSLSGVIDTSGSARGS